MAHLVENMFSVRQAPWHKLGVIIEEAPTIEEGIKLAGLDWTVRTEQLFLKDGREAPALSTVRESDNSILGAVGPNYVPLQNLDAFRFFQPFLDGGLAKLETAGSLDDGKKIWVMATLNRDPIVVTGDDIVQKYLLLSNTHDGSMAIRAGFTPVRVVCNNTLNLALNNKASELIKIRHTGSTKDTLEQVQGIINTADQQFEATAEQYRRLAQKQISAKDLERYVKIVYQISEKEELATRTKDRLDQVYNIFERSLGSDLVNPEKSYWLAYNAITEQVQHMRGNNEAKRLEAVWFGEGKRISQRALETALVMAA